MVGRMWSRLLDKTKAPRRWWASECRFEFASDEEWRQQHDETSQTIRRVMVVLVVYSFFCLLSLGASDSSLVGANATIKVPFANTEVSFLAFLFIGPVVLVALAAYLHIFVDYKRMLDVSGKGPGLPYLFNMQSLSARLLSRFIFYWLVPCVLGVFSYKASARDEGPLLVLLTMVVMAWLIWMQIRRCPSGWRRGIYRSLWLAGVIVVIAKFNLIGEKLFTQRELMLFGANLNEQDLRDADLYRADLREAKLYKTNLSRANLKRAKLRWSNLNETALGWADLEGADLEGANLKGANLYGTKLYEANLIKARGLTQEQLNVACIDKKTILPDHLTPPQSPLEACQHWDPSPEPLAQP